MLPLIQGLFDGISIGSVLLLAALGLAIVFGLMGVINLAHGELMMLGAYTTFVVQNTFKAYLPESLYNYYFFFAIPCAFIVAAIVGLLLEKSVIRFLYGRPLETLLATWGVSLILRQFVRSVSGMLALCLGVFCLLFLGGLAILKRRSNWQSIKDKAIALLLTISGGIAIALGILINKSDSQTWTKPWFDTRNVDVSAPKWLQEGLSLGSLQFAYTRLFIIVLTIICVAAIYWFLNGTTWGLKIRSVTQNRTMSACLGIPTEQVDAITFALGSGLAGIAGCAITLLGSVGPNVGQLYIVDTFMVVVVGGVGNLLGTILAALAIGIITYLIGTGTIALLLPATDSLKPIADFFTFFATTSMAKVMIFALIIAFLQVKPSGIFPQKGRAVEN